MVDTPAVDTTVMDSVDSVMPTMVKQTNKQTKRIFKNQIMKKNITLPLSKKSTKKLPSDIVLKISSRNQKKFYCAMMLIVMCLQKLFVRYLYFCYLNSTKT